MTLGEIKERVMFQPNNDSEDIGDYLPALEGYINDGYDRLVNIWANKHVPCAEYPILQEIQESEEEEESSEEWPADTPKTPEWTHPYLADWATWLVYRNGNPQKQQRGYSFRESFERMLSRIADEGGENGQDENGNRVRYTNFRNIPT